MLPESNVRNVAFDIVDQAMSVEVIHPGAGILSLCEALSRIANELRAASNAATRDWHGSLADFPTPEIEGMVRRQEQTAVDVWATHWLVCQIAKCLHDNLLHSCSENSIASAIAAITYDPNGSASSWKQREV